MKTPSSPPPPLPVFGFEVDGARPHRSCLQGPSLAPSGNVVLRAGHNNGLSGGGWSSTEHIVLTPAEAEDLARLLLSACGAA